MGVGIAADAPSIRAEFEAAGVPFEKRVGRMMEGLRLCKAFWSGDRVNWDGRWKVEDSTLGPTPHRAGGPPIWGGGSAEASLTRAGRNFDGWFPTGPDSAGWGKQWKTVCDAAAEAGRAGAVTGAVYLTVSIDENAQKADDQINDYLEQYYGVPGEVIRRRQACFAGPEAEFLPWLKGYADAGASHLMIRVVGDHEQHLGILAKAREALVSA
jgi:alkanesulfonate monooxygenase SsuD/methylene tetrahydromethanopterin reductase-like flavin-dependent oxidoreductase (luciferase family)